ELHDHTARHVRSTRCARTIGLEGALARRPQITPDTPWRRRISSEQSSIDAAGGYRLRHRPPGDRTLTTAEGHAEQGRPQDRNNETKTSPVHATPVGKTD